MVPSVGLGLVDLAKQIYPDSHVPDIAERPSSAQYFPTGQVVIADESAGQ